MSGKYFLLGVVVLASIVPVCAAEDEESGVGFAQAPIDWQHGPAVGKLGNGAQINVPEGYLFANGDQTRLIMSMMQNPPTNQELGLIAPKDSSWFIIFEFSDDGYVKDDDKADLDADALFKVLKESNIEGNKERKRRGWKALDFIGWEVRPHYDDQTHNLEWATQHRGEGEDYISVNYNTRLLGRYGIMSATLVGDQSELAAITPTFKSLLGGFTFTPGNTYAEWREGDKVASYGLAALITGGAAAAAIKSGVLPKLMKAIVAGGIAVVAVIGGALKKLFGRSDSTVMSS